MTLVAAVQPSGRLPGPSTGHLRTAQTVKMTSTGGTHPPALSTNGKSCVWSTGTASMSPDAAMVSLDDALDSLDAALVSLNDALESLDDALVSLDDALVSLDDALESLNGTLMSLRP